MSGLFTLHQWVGMAKMFGFNSNFIGRFVLTGRVTQGDQVIVNPRQNLIQEEHPITLLRYYDTIIGLTSDIVVQVPFAVISPPEADNVFRADFSITCPLGVSEIAAGLPLHKIPNFMFGFWGQQHEIHIFFPSLAYEARQDSQLTDTQMQVFRLCCLDPAIRMWGSKRPGSSFQSGDLPEMFSAPRKPGGKPFGAKLLDWYFSDSFVRRMRQGAVNEGVCWGMDFFFVHTIRGITRAVHHANNPHAATEDLTTYIRNANLPDDIASIGEWWVDVGVEIASAEGLCLQWSTLSHSRMVQEVLQIDESSANCITDLESSEYTRDLASHLSAVSGCRIEPGPRYEGRYGVKYFQMYTTDRAVVYAPEDGSYGTTLTIDDAMRSDHPSEFVSGLYDFFWHASESKASRARVEVRVPLEHAVDVLQSLNPPIQGLMGFTPHDWWLFKAFRVAGISRGLQVLSEYPAEARMKPEVLALTAACVWLINTINTPLDDDPTSRELARAVLPLTDATGSNRDLLVYPRSKGDGEPRAAMPYIPFGVISLLGKSTLEALPIRSSGSFLSAEAFLTLFGTSFENICSKYAGDSGYNMDEGELEEGEDVWGEAGSELEEAGMASPNSTKSLEIVSK